MSVGDCGAHRAELGDEQHVADEVDCGPGGGGGQGRGAALFNHIHRGEEGAQAAKRRAEREHGRVVPRGEMVKALSSAGAIASEVPLEPDGVSSTAVRRKLARGEDYIPELDSSVYRYIREKSLYV